MAMGGDMGPPGPGGPPPPWACCRTCWSAAAAAAAAFFFWLRRRTSRKMRTPIRARAATPPTTPPTMAPTGAPPELSLSGEGSEDALAVLSLEVASDVLLGWSGSNGERVLVVEVVVEEEVADEVVSSVRKLASSMGSKGRRSKSSSVQRIWMAGADDMTKPSLSVWSPYP